MAKWKGRKRVTKVTKMFYTCFQKMKILQKCSPGSFYFSSGFSFSFSKHLLLHLLGNVRGATLLCFSSSSDTKREIGEDCLQMLSNEVKCFKSSFACWAHISGSLFLQFFCLQFPLLLSMFPHISSCSGNLLILSYSLSLSLSLSLSVFLHFLWARVLQGTQESGNAW